MPLSKEIEMDGLLFDSQLVFSSVQLSSTGVFTIRRFGLDANAAAAASVSAFHPLSSNIHLLGIHSQLQPI